MPHTINLDILSSFPVATSMVHFLFWVDTEAPDLKGGVNDYSSDVIPVKPDLEGRLSNLERQIKEILSHLWPFKIVKPSSGLPMLYGTTIGLCIILL